MNRAERRHRTESVRNRRINLSKQVESQWRNNYRSDDAALRDRWCWMSRWTWRYTEESDAALEWEKDCIEKAILEAKMRNEYIPGYRDDSYWFEGRQRKMKVHDFDFWAWMNELGIATDLRPRGKARYFPRTSG